jgi:hypothetical protein
VAFLLAGCDSPTAPQGELLDTFSAERHLTLINRTDDPVYFIVVESELAARTLFFICSDPVDCRHVAPGASVSIAYTQIAGYQPGRQAVVLHWRIIGNPMFGYHADEVRSLMAPLR